MDAESISKLKNKLLEVASKWKRDQNKCAFECGQELEKLVDEIMKEQEQNWK